MPSWDKGFEVLQRVADSPGAFGVRELAREVDLPKSSVHYLVTQLAESGLVVRQPDTGKYAPGGRLIRLAIRVMAKVSARTQALPVLRQLAQRFNETVYYCLFDHEHDLVIPVDLVESSHNLRFVVDVGESLPLYCGSTSKAIMAHLPESEVQAVIAATGLARVTPDTITDPAELLADLEKTRRRGYSVSYGERQAQVVGFGSAVLDNAGRVVGEITMTIPKARFVPGTEAVFGSAVREAAAQVSASLGYFPPEPVSAAPQVEELG